MDRLTAAWQRRDGLPDGFLSAAPRALRAIMPVPTLVHLAGRDPRALLVSILLHGNETTGLLAVQRLLRERRALPRSLWLFVGNVAACEAGVRHLPGQPDHNRIWGGGDDPAARMAREVLAAIEDPLFAAIDVHNTTGRNPHYAAMSTVTPATVGLATLFSRPIVAYRQPAGTLSAALSSRCPALTIECGLAGATPVVGQVAQLLDDVLHLTELPRAPLGKLDFELYQTTGKLRLPAGARPRFTGTAAIPDDADVAFDLDFDEANFARLEPGALLCRARPGMAPRVEGAAGEDLSARYLVCDGEAVRVRAPFTPSLLTRDAAIIASDCLGYCMEPLDPAAWPTG